MPVTSISFDVACSAKVGASRWIELRLLCGIGPASSTGSPMTFMIRPSVPGPTGTMIGPPVSTTAWPRVRPSVASMAMVRTVFSPRCWATSSTSRTASPLRWSWLVVSSADRMAGRWPSNSTSTTAPITWVMRPVATPCGSVSAGLVASIVAMCGLGSRLKRLGAGDDLDQLLGDLRLAGSVHDQGQAGDHVAGVAGGVVHSRHLGGVEAGVILEHGGEQLHADVARQQGGEDGFLVRLVLVGRALQVDGGRGALDLGRDQLLAGRDLADHRTE